MPVSITPDPNDPYFIDSVPMYRDFRKEEADLNDTIGDRFFEQFAHTLENTPPVNQPMEENANASVESSTNNKTQAKTRPVSRRSVTQAHRSGPTSTQPLTRFGNTSTARRSVITKETEQPALAPKVQAKPRPVSRRSMSQMCEVNSTIVQPPMRFGNTSTASRPVVTKVIAESPAPAPKIQEQPAPAPKIQEQPAPKIQEQPAPASKIQERQTRASKVQAMPRPVSRRSMSQMREVNSTIVQPPMRFGNTSTASRPVVTNGNRDNVVTAPVRGTISTRSVVSAAKASGVSHAVRGISVVRNGPTKKQPQQKDEK